MYKSKSVLALITARGGSKGIPFKNIKHLGQKPLIAWTIEAARKSNYIDRLILSSDDHDIIQVAKKWDCEVPFLRPKELARDDSSSIDVVLHAIDALTQRYNYVLLLQPTSPFRTQIHIDAIIEACVDSDSPMMISVSRLKKHPAYMYEIIDGRLKSFLGSKSQVRRQDMPHAFEHNGAMYLSRTDFLKQKKCYNVDGVMPFQMFGYSNLDIDDPIDFEYAEFLISTGRIII